MKNRRLAAVINLSIIALFVGAVVGLTVFAKNKYPALMDTVKTISVNDKAGVNKNKAKLVLEKINK